MLRRHIFYYLPAGLNMIMSDLRKFINILSEAEPKLKKTVIDLVKTTDDETLLQRVLNTLKAGNIDERIVKVLGQDPDASRFVKQIASVIVNMEFPIESKDAFLKRFPQGIVDPKKLLSGKPMSFLELVGGDEFSKELFKLLTTTLTSQGVGPGEVALAVMHPSIQWSGRAAGGGDIMIGKRAIEVKTTVSSGGRWINPRKAKMDLAGIEQTIVDATGIATWPDRINVNTWVNEVIPAIVKRNPKNLSTVSSKIASKLFTAVNTSAYKDALASGDVAAIVDEHLRTGYENYKVLSEFEGILIMDVRTETAQYFKDYDSMKGKIKNDMVYIYAPEGEIMPKVTLLPVAGVSSVAPKAGAAAAPAAPVAKPKAASASMPADRIQRPGALKFPEPGTAPVASRQKR